MNRMGCLTGTSINTIVVLCGVFLQICAFNWSDAVDIEEHIRRRNLRQDGYTHVQSASLKFIYKKDEVLQSFTNSRHVREADYPGEPVELHIVSGDERFEILLKRTEPVLNEGARFVYISGDNEETSDIIEPRECYMSGSLVSEPENTAVISFCDGLRGGLTNGSYIYYFEEIEDCDKETLLLARKEKNALQKSYERDSHERLNSHIGERHKREVPTINIETVVVLDEAYVANIRAAGHASNASIVDLITLKFTGVQAEWGKSDVLGYNVVIDIKQIVVFEKNPTWFTPDAELRIALYRICTGARDQGLWGDFDHIHLFTGISNTDVSGKAYDGGMCIDGSKCAVSTDTSIAEYYIAAHEIGHLLGMIHDDNCTTKGIMGGLTSGWSDCSVHDFNDLLDDISNTTGCLYTTDVNTTNVVTVNSVWPGMVYSDDEICALQNGEGFVYKGSMNSCSGYRCINLDTTSDKYGVSFKHTAPTDGRYCGENMVCTTSQANYRCINITDTGLNSSLITYVTGEWSEWGSTTSCSRTCGNGVQYRKRTCDNPKPQNSPWCDGNAFVAELCNMQPCDDDSSDEAELVTQRAGETCNDWKTNDMYTFIAKDSTNYLNTGTKYGSSDDDQCDVKCDAAEGYTVESSERHGIMPDGTSCSPSSLSSFVENNNLPRKSDMYGSCVKGFCYLIGCDNRSGNTQNDGCGVCGGDNSTCQVVEGGYDTVLANGARGRIVRLPANSSLFQVHFIYNSMQSHFLELRTKDTGTSEFGPIVLNGLYTLDTTSNPVNFAGTYWYYDWIKQYMYAFGPTNQAVDIVLHNFGNKENAGVTYGYSLPTASEMASCAGTCENGGTWNSSTCSCDCAAGYYGISCDTTCNKVCKNGQSLATSGCKCDCQGNTYGTTCSCKYAFTGKDCQDCKITSCENGGTFNATTCRCTCPQGYGHLDCSTTCTDAGLTTEDCLVRVGNGHCVSKNELMEEKCYKSCDLCEPSDTTTSTTSTTTSTSTASTASGSTSGTSSPTQSTTRIRTGTCKARRQNRK